MPAHTEAVALSRAELRRRATGAVSSREIQLELTSDAATEKVAEASALLPNIEAPAALPAAEAPLPVSDAVAVSSRRAARAARMTDAATAPVEPIAEASEPASTPAPAAGELDEFEVAARLFSFTGETPVQVAAAAIEAAEAEEAREAAEAASADAEGGAGRTRRGGRSLRRMATASFSVGVMGIVGLLAVGMTTPAEAVAAGSDKPENSAVSLVAGDVAGDIDSDDIQAFVAPASSGVDVSRSESYATTTVAELAAESGIKNFSDFFHNDPNSPIQWPFVVGVPISYGFGPRPGEFHQGVDFTPGAGSPIQAIADGVVRVATENGGGYGVHVIIDHVIDGQLVSSHYAHMQYGSLQVQVGQHVTVGTVLGRTGDTGYSFGAHTHVEILMNGTTPIDPLPWLRQHAGG